MAGRAFKLLSNLHYLATGRYLRHSVPATLSLTGTQVYMTMKYKPSYQYQLPRVLFVTARNRMKCHKQAPYHTYCPGRLYTPYIAGGYMLHPTRPMSKSFATYTHASLTPPSTWHIATRLIKPLASCLWLEYQTECLIYLSCISIFGKAL